MDKLLFFLFVLCLTSETKANDTLTIRQIYDFSIGDVFGYTVQENSTSPANPTTSSYTMSILDKRISASNDTLFYVRQTGSNIDTLILTNLDQSISLQDTPTSCNCSLRFVLDSACSNVRNTLNWNNPLYYNSYSYIKSLGMVRHGSGGDDGSYIDTSLSYYIRNGIRYQTPFSLSDIAHVPDLPFLVYPSPATDLIHLSLEASGKYSYLFTLRDVLGNQVLVTTISEKESYINIETLPSGSYVWQLSFEDRVVKGGKILKSVK